MTRRSRLDIPGLLQHVIVRGIERRNIFRTDVDRDDFVNRLSALLVETHTDCFAWALIPNHFHLLLKPIGCDLKHFMRRLLTGYAVNFNKRYRRSGHLFQNRYKSIVCEEDIYLLELIRYIHLNPLRAGLVTDLDTLARFPWCGHGGLLGCTPALDGQCTGEVLALFDNHQASAVKRYKDFIADGVVQADRPELSGGGLNLSGRRHDSRETQAFDGRVLGSGDFVEKLSENNMLQERLATRMDLDALARRVAKHFQITPEKLTVRSRDQERINARDLYCFIAVRLLGYNGVQTGKMLGLQRAAVSHAVNRGSLLAKNDTRAIEAILTAD